jgi:hypothetical protein
MANNYCESSSLFSFPVEKQKQAEKIVEAVNKSLEEDEDEGYVGYKADFEEDGLWIRHDESITPVHVVQLIQALLDGLEIDEPFVFSWSYTCSKPRIDEFGGGACALKRGKEPYWIDALSHAQNHKWD